MVYLKKITNENFNDCIHLKVADEQSHFVSSNMYSLAKAYVFYDIVTPWAIYSDDIMVGFIMLRFNQEYNNYFIWQFMVDQRYQAKGYGKQALKLAIDWMKQDHRCHNIVTTYIVGNEKVRKLYSDLGFQQMKESEEDEIDMILYLSY